MQWKRQLAVLLLNEPLLFDLDTMFTCLLHRARYIVEDEEAERPWSEGQPGGRSSGDRAEIAAGAYRRKEA